MPFTEIGKAAQSAIYRAGTFGRRPKVPTDGAALEDAARRVMSRRGFAYVAGSAGGEATATANREAFARWRVVPRMLVDTTERDLGVDLFGRRHASPLLVSPIGVLSAAHADADLAVARAAVEQEVTPILSTQASVPMEDVAAELGGAGHWYQLYWSRDDDLVASLVRRAEACGSEAIVVTLDTAYLGWRPRDLDLGHLPFARGEGIAQYTSDPVFRRLVEERVAAAAARHRERAPAAPHPGGGAHPGVAEPQPPRRHPAQPVGPRATGGGRDLPRRVLQAVAELGRPAPPARADQPPGGAQGSAPPRRRPARGRRGGRRHPRVEPRRAAGRPLGGGARRPARRGGCRALLGLGRAGALRQRHPLGRRRVRRARAGRGCRGHRPPARLRPRDRRRRGGGGGAAQHQGRARPHHGAHRLPHPGRRDPRPPRRGPGPH